MTSAPPSESWPSIPEDLLSSPQKERFEARVAAIKRYVAGDKVKLIRRDTGISEAELPRLLRRCLAPAEDGRIQGFRALRPGARIAQYKRSAASRPKLPEAQGGMAGELSALLDRLEGFEEDLVQIIKKQSKQTGIPEHKIRPVSLHKYFLDYIESRGVKPPAWPFNTKHRGRRSITTFMKSVVDANLGVYISTTGDRPSVAHWSTGTGTPSVIRFEEPFDAVELDAFEIPALLTVAFETPEQTLVEKLIERLWLIAMIERVTNAVIAHTIVYASEVNTDDVVRVLRRAVEGRDYLPELTIPGLRYPKDGGLPAIVLPEFRGALWGCLMLDGALAHLASKVRDAARQRLGMVVNYGPVGHFERRPNIERLFSDVAVNVFHRLPSTTGSSPNHGRAKNAAQAAVKFRIKAQHAEELTAIRISQFNATPSEGSSYLSPLEHLNYYVQRKHFLIRKWPFAKEGSSPLPTTRWCTVRGGVKSGRRPHITLDGVRYTNQVLGSAGALVGKRILVEIDDDDYRHVNAFTASGAALGSLRAGGRWGHTKHSRQTRRAINSLVTRRILKLSQFDDPVLTYLAYLSRDSKAKHSQARKEITAAARVAKEAGEVLKTNPTQIKPPPLPQPKSEPGRNILGTRPPDLRRILSRRKV